MPKTDLEEQGTALAMGVGGAGLIGQAIKDPNFKQMATANMHNFLPGFYRKGVTDVGKKFKAGKEGLRGGAHAVHQGLNPRDSYAYKSSGISNRLAGKINENHKQIKKITERYLADPNYTYKQAQKDITFQVKESHSKITNDFSNARLYEGARGQSQPLKDYVARKGSPKGTIAFVENSTVKQAATEVGKHELTYMRDIQGIDPSKRVAMLKYGRQSIQNPLRGIQFESKVYKAFQELAVLRQDGQLSQSSFLSVLDDVGLLQSKKGKPLFRQLSKNKIAFNLSPAIKTNFDWGGYNGVVVWDKKNPDYVKLLASDRRDLFKIKLNRQALNYVEPQKLRIASFEQDFNKAVMDVEKAVEGSLTDEPKKIKKTKKSKKPSVRKTRLEQMKFKIDSLKEKLLRIGKLTPEEMALLESRKSGIEGVDNLGKSHKSVIKAQETLLEQRRKALTRAKSGSHHYKKYVSKSWLPKRLGIGKGILGLGWGAAQLMNTLMED